MAINVVKLHYCISVLENMKFTNITNIQEIAMLLNCIMLQGRIQDLRRGGFDLVLKSDTGGATNIDDFLKHHQGSIKSDIQVEYEAT